MRYDVIKPLLLFTLPCFMSCKSMHKADGHVWFSTSWEKISAAKTHSIEWVTDPKGSHEEVLKFEVRPGDSWINHGKVSFRSEVATNEFVPLNSAMKYEFEIFLPQDFPIEDNRLVLAQWWAKPKKNLGESSRSPSMALRFRSGKLHLTIRNSKERVIKDPDQVSSKEIFEATQFKLGEWHRFIFEIYWSYKPDGRAKVWIDGEQVADYSGGIGYNDDIGPEFQFGIYRDDTLATYKVYYRNVRSSYK